MQVGSINSTSFDGISVDKRYQYKFERKVIINSIKNKLLHGKLTDNRGRDLYQKFDRKGYNFFLTPGWNNSIDVYIDKVKTDKSGKKQYKHEYCIGSFNSQNIHTFEESIKNIKKEENKFMLNALLHLIAITSAFGLALLGVLLKK